MTIIIGMRIAIPVPVANSNTRAAGTSCTGTAVCTHVQYIYNVGTTCVGCTLRARGIPTVLVLPVVLDLVDLRYASSVVAVPGHDCGNVTDAFKHG